jgi:glycerol-3-phosphate acyltransferase PlsY
MSLLGQLLPFALLGYLLGSVPFAVLVSRVFGLADPRSFGSGNPGATNVLRTGNKLAALLTLVGDALKGWLAMLLTANLGAGETGVAVAGVAAFLGHVFPVFLRFRGGKGVATALGVLAGFSGLLAAVAAAVWLVVALVSRYSSLASVVTAVTAPVAAWLLLGRADAAVAVAAMSALLVWRHRPNLQRLRDGTESRIGSKKKG